MLFNSFQFLLLFLPIVLLAFVFLARTGNTEAQILWLIVASLVFYGSWNPAFVALIVLSAAVNFRIGRFLAITLDEANKQRWLVIGVLFNLGLLGYFKYADFFIENLNALGVWFIPLPEITLPLAISFFTFQQIAYLVDVRRGKCKEYQLRHYALFVAFFPQLIAGPIVHHREMMPQFENLRRRDELWPDLAVGFTIMAIGLFKKVVLADSLAQYADPLFGTAANGGALNAIDSWIATLSFSFQIYFDFSGYSDMAIGSARLFGIRLPENFRSPYKAKSVIEIWDRWHITLSRFLRDYLYIALGGNRNGPIRRYRNLLITMLLGGLWHGAAWTYVVWGGLHGIYLCLNHGWRALCRKTGMTHSLESPWLTPIYIICTFLAWSLALVVFRAPDIKTSISVMAPGFTEFSIQQNYLLNSTVATSTLGKFFEALGFASGSYLSVYLTLGVSAVVIWMLPNTQTYMRDFDPALGVTSATSGGLINIQWRPGIMNALIIAFMLSTGLLSLSAISEFIYFQF
ncbi:MBOAT family protein [Halioglobus sp.]|nr:MBOAT family protein [Halioglobus sp.]